MSLRPIDVESQGDAFAQLQAEAFAVAPDVIPKWWKLAGHEHVRVWGDEPGPHVLGGLIEIPMGLFVGGRSVPVMGVAGVTVSATARGLGVGRSMLRAHLDGLTCPLSILYGSTRSFYARSGYGLGGTRNLVSMPMDALRGVGTAMPGWRRIEADDWGSVEAAQRASVQHRVAMDRGPYLWQRIRKSRETPRQYWCLGAPGQVVAWVVLEQEPLQGSEFFALHLLDHGAVSGRSWDALVAFIGGFSAMCHRLRFACGRVSPLLERLPEFREEVTLFEPFMVRVADVKGALEARGWSPYLQLSFELTVRDAVLPSNDGSWKVSLSGGRGAVERVSSAVAEIDVAGLASLYTGHLTPVDLALTGRLSAPDEVMAALQAAFAGPSPGIAEFF